jgi:hypothetical protein
MAGRVMALSHGNPAKRRLHAIRIESDRHRCLTENKYNISKRQEKKTMLVANEESPPAIVQGISCEQNAEGDFHPEEPPGTISVRQPKASS